MFLHPTKINKFLEKEKNSTFVSRILAGIDRNTVFDQGRNALKNKLNIHFEDEKEFVNGIVELKCVSNVDDLIIRDIARTFNDIEEDQLLLKYVLSACKENIVGYHNQALSYFCAWLLFYCSPKEILQCVNELARSPTFYLFEQWNISIAKNTNLIMGDNILEALQAVDDELYQTIIKYDVDSMKIAEIIPFFVSSLGVQILLNQEVIQFMDAVFDYGKIFIYRFLVYLMLWRKKQIFEGIDEIKNKDEPNESVNICNKIMNMIKKETTDIASREIMIIIADSIANKHEVFNIKFNMWITATKYNTLCRNENLSKAKSYWNAYVKEDEYDDDEDDYFCKICGMMLFRDEYENMYCGICKAGFCDEGCKCKHQMESKNIEISPITEMERRQYERKIKEQQQEIETLNDIKEFWELEIPPTQIMETNENEMGISPVRSIGFGKYRDKSMSMDDDVVDEKNDESPLLHKAKHRVDVKYLERNVTLEIERNVTFDALKGMAISAFNISFNISLKHLKLSQVCIDTAEVMQRPKLFELTINKSDDILTLILTGNKSKQLYHWEYCATLVVDRKKYKYWDESLRAEIINMFQGCYEDGLSVSIWKSNALYTKLDEMVHSGTYGVEFTNTMPIKKGIRDNKIMIYLYKYNEKRMVTMKMDLSLHKSNDLKGQKATIQKLTNKIQTLLGGVNVNKLFLKQYNKNIVELTEKIHLKSMRNRDVIIVDEEVTNLKDIISKYSMFFVS